MAGLETRPWKRHPAIKTRHYSTPLQLHPLLRRWVGRRWSCKHCKNKMLTLGLCSYGWRPGHPRLVNSWIAIARNSRATGRSLILSCWWKTLCTGNSLGLLEPTDICSCSCQSLSVNVFWRLCMRKLPVILRTRKRWTTCRGGPSGIAGRRMSSCTVHAARLVMSSIGGVHPSRLARGLCLLRPMLWCELTRASVQK